MSLQDLPSPLLALIVSYVVADRWLQHAHTRDQVAALRLTCRTLNGATVYQAFSRLDVAANRGHLDHLNTQALALVAREKARLPNSPGVLFTSIADLSAVLISIAADEPRLQREDTEYVPGFIDAAIVLLGPRDIVDHLAFQNLPAGVCFFGSRFNAHHLALLAAAWQGDLELVLFLLDSESLKPAGKSLLSAFYLAAFKGHTELLCLLKEHGNIQVDAPCGFYGNALMAAVAGGSLESIDCIIEWGADVNFLGTLFGRPLTLAVSSGCLGAVQLLLEAGAEENACDMMKQSPLVVAAIKKPHTIALREILELLLLRNAEISILPKEKAKAFAYAASYDNPSAVEILLKNGITDDLYGTALITSAIANTRNLDVVRLLLERLGDSTLPSSTLLTTAIQRNFPELVKLCIEEKDDFDPCMYEASIALENSLRDGYVNIPKMLFDSGARLRLTEQDVLWVAEKVFDTSLIDRLAECGLEFDANTFECAIRFGNPFLLSKTLSEGFEYEALGDGEYLPPKVRLCVWDTELPAVQGLLNTNAIRFSSITVSDMLQHATQRRDVATVKRLTSCYPGAVLQTYPGNNDDFAATTIAMLLHSAEKTFRKDEAAALLKEQGPEIVAIANELQEKNIQLCSLFKSTTTKLSHFIELGCVSALEFFLRSSGAHAMQRDHKVLAAIKDIDILTMVLKYYPKELSSQLTDRKWCRHVFTKAVESRNHPLVEYLVKLGFGEHGRAFHVYPRNNHTGLKPSYCYEKDPVLASETMLRLFMAREGCPLVDQDASVVEWLKYIPRDHFATQLQILVDDGADINTPIPSVGNALSVAVAHGNEDMVRLLLAYGADPGPCVGAQIQSTALCEEARFVPKLLAQALVKNMREKLG
ncbi:hypothetical protein LOZ61_004600 [Ophidiomyces ophidiicola]|uniref:Uncharacterized protein n=1 Tax=Ophidiomyces ophidiicola TaxID=1387563 RepID=A0ACB8V150_9EURO|nr:hypothetical protein LOZ61_004600 [Ophidiomyces ophidiicola]KAI1927183.1 hypothetical protein LOZ60_003235 [Ophidiomyces ophidiicola]KAI2145035.1 hypothetical protein LOZ27_003414 [Ophidiomyces ophidiicola]KAI2160989.1 hypothetical protein LOZ25_002426 [Ophidiomyces ophidiicola]KAI2195132.1 hypothetical protein LOZ20_003608 [Ophidiomyces ophidiicola]